MNGIFLDFPSVGIMIGAIHAFFLAAYLLTLKKGNTLSFRILAALLFSMGVGMSGNVVHQADFFIAFPFLGLFFPLNEFFYGPLFFLYVQSMVKTDFNWKSSDYYHFIPALLFLFLIIWPADAVKNGLWGLADGRFLKLLISIQFLIYLFLSFKAWLQHSVRIQNYYASLEKIRMNWLRNILIGMGLVYLVSLLSFIFTSAEILKLAPLFGAVLIYVTAYLGMKHASLFTTEERLQASQMKNPASKETKSSKYQNSALEEGRKGEISLKMSGIMEIEKLFTDNKLTLPKLAARIGVSTHHLSQVLNEEIGQTFFDYVNEYRVKEVQQLMANPAFSNYSLLGLAMEAGFNSKSAFNTVFKKYTQQTPLQYKKSISRENFLKKESIPIGKGAS